MHRDKNGELTLDADEELDEEAYLRAQREEATKEKGLNKYYTQINLGREASPDEMMMHFALYGGAEDFRERELKKYIIKKSSESSA